MLKTFKKGDVVRAFIVSVDTEKKRLSFSLKPSHFFDEELEDVEMASEKRDQNKDSDDESEIVMDGRNHSVDDSRDEEEVRHYAHCQQLSA